MKNFEALESRVLLSAAAAVADIDASSLRVAAHPLTFIIIGSPPLAEVNIIDDTSISPLPVFLPDPSLHPVAEVNIIGLQNVTNNVIANTSNQDVVYSEIIGEEPPPYNPEIGLYNGPEQFLRVITWNPFYEGHIDVQEYTKGESGEFDQLRSNRRAVRADRVLLRLQDGVELSDVEHLIEEAGGTVIRHRLNSKNVVVQINGEVGLNTVFEVMGQLQEHALQYFKVVSLDGIIEVPSVGYSPRFELDLSGESINNLGLLTFSISSSSSAQTGVSRFSLLGSNASSDLNSYALTQINLDLSLDKDGIARQQELGLV